MSCARPVIRAAYLGLVPYQQALKIQEQCVEYAVNKEHPRDTLLLLQHPPVYTLGIRRTDPANDLSSSGVDKLRALGADFQYTRRGGLITFHGPGQLVVYPVLGIRRYASSARFYVEGLQQVLVETCSQLGLPGVTVGHSAAEVGAWIEGRKIAALGVRLSRGVASHGIALNCDVDLRWFHHVVPCGLVGKEVTSLTQELGREVPVREVLSPLRYSFEKVFSCDMRQLDCSATRKLLHHK